MGSRLVLGAIVILSIILFPVKSDSLGFSDDGLPVSDNGLPVSDNGLSLSSNQPDSALDLGFLPQDGSDLFSEDLGGGDLFASDNSDLNAGCSSSEFVPVVGKARIRRRDGSGVCTGSETSLQSGRPPFDAARSPLGLGLLQRLLSASPDRQQQNSICITFSAGVLPWGVCYTPTETGLDMTRARTILIPPEKVFMAYYLDHCLLAAGVNAICPQLEQQFYCCQGFGPNLPALDEGSGMFCVALSLLMGEPF